MQLRNQDEYLNTLKLIEGMNRTIERHREYYAAQGYEAEHMARALGPMQCLVAGWEWEAEEYQRNLRGEIRPEKSLDSLGEQLIALRLARGLTQRELARRLGVSESQISRDENNRYCNVSPRKAERILAALDGEIEIRVHLAPEGTKRKATPPLTQRRGRPRVPHPVNSPRSKKLAA